MRSIRPDAVMEVVGPLIANILTLRAERDAIIGAFGGYRTDRLAVVEKQLPILEKIAEELHDRTSELVSK